VLPDVPPVADFVPVMSQRFGGRAAQNTPADIIACEQGAQCRPRDSKIRARIVELGGTCWGAHPRRSDDHLGCTEKWAKVINFAGIKVE